MDGEILFISDLHLQRDEPDISRNLLTFLKARAANARALFILGDFFEVWLGDDDPAEEFSPIFDALHHLSTHCELFFLPGNRDFLVGQRLAQRCGFSIIEDGYRLTLDDRRIALMHGDTLCTGDTDYQAFRQQVRSAPWQQDFLAKPLAERQAISRALRDQSQSATRHKQPTITDVNADAVAEYFAANEIDVLIHGHTHRPAIHAKNKNQTRIVLGDWQPTTSYLSWRDGEFTLIDERVQPPPRA